MEIGKKKNTVFLLINNEDKSLLKHPFSLLEGNGV